MRGRIADGGGRRSASIVTRLPPALNRAEEDTCMRASALTVAMACLMAALVPLWACLGLASLAVDVGLFTNMRRPLSAKARPESLER